MAPPLRQLVEKLEVKIACFAPFVFLRMGQIVDSLLDNFCQLDTLIYEKVFSSLNLLGDMTDGVWGHGFAVNTGRTGLWGRWAVCVLAVLSGKTRESVSLT